MRACEAVWVREGGAPQRWRLEWEEVRLRRDSGAECTFCVFAIIRLGFKENELQKLRKAVGFLNILLYSLLFAWVLWKLLDANPYFAAMRMGFKRILEMLSLYSWVLSNLFAGPV